MYSPSTFITSCCCILMIVFIKSSCAYAVDSNELTNSLIDQQFGLNLPSYYYDRNVRATPKFPRIGRSFVDSDDSFDLSAENFDEQRTRLDKRAFHNLLWANSRSNPHRVFDGQGRYQINGYDYHINPLPSKSMSRYRTKRNLSM